MLDPRDLYTLHDTGSAGPRGDTRGDASRGPVLLHALTGFVDAGQAGRLAARAPAGDLRAPPRRHVRRRHLARLPLPPAADGLRVRPLGVVRGAVAAAARGRRRRGHAVPAAGGRRARRAVGAVHRRGPRPGRAGSACGSRSVSTASPWASRTPGPRRHRRTRTRRELVAGREPWIGTVQVPGSVINLLEYRLGQAGHDAMGFAVHVPHYLAQAEYPAAAAALLDNVAAATGLCCRPRRCARPPRQTRTEIDEQVAASPEVAGGGHGPRAAVRRVPRDPVESGPAATCWPAGAAASRRRTSWAPSWSGSSPTTPRATSRRPEAISRRLVNQGTGSGAPHGAWPLVAASCGTRGYRDPAPWTAPKDRVPL